MAEQHTKPPVLPWFNLVMIAGLGGSLLFYLVPLTSSRPSAQPSQDTVSWHAQDVDARLWQDPFDVSAKHAGALRRAAIERTLLPAEMSAEEHVHNPDRVTNDLGWRACASDACSPSRAPAKVLAVMVRGGPYAEDVERRLRTRDAIVEGLSASHFIPRDNAHVGYVMLDWPIDGSTAWSGGSRDQASDRRTLLVPYEWYKREHDSDDGANGVSALLVLWLRDSAFDDAPLTRLAWLLARLGLTSDCARGQIAVIGPSTSSGLRSMVEEDTLPAGARALLDGVTMYSASATAAEEELLGTSIPEMSVKKVLEERIPGFTLNRTIATDPEVIETLINELSLRQVWNQTRGPLGHVAIFAEADSLYGRSLPRTFLGVTDRRRKKNASDGTGNRVHYFHYLEGIDGKVPGDGHVEPNGKKADAMAPKSNGDVLPREAQEGMDQSDYLRRLAAQLQSQDTEFRRQGEPGYVAVGLLGADVYDKLMILRALRQALPNAIFFTNNIDVRLGHPVEWEATHNLVIASPYGLTLRSDTDTARYAQFRDSYQTAVFAATLMATGNRKVRPENPHVYEIGVRGPYELNIQQTDPTGAARASRWPTLLLLMSFGFGIGCWAVRVSMGERLHAKQLLTRTPCFLVVAAIVIAALFALLGQVPIARNEPVVFADGISIWPSEALRLFAALLAFHFMAKALDLMGRSDGDIEREYLLRPIGAEQIEPTEPCDRSASDIVDVQALWTSYVRLGRFRARLLRFAPPALLYYGFGFGVMALCGFPSFPGRGDLSWWADLFITRGFAVFMTIGLLFFVIDAMLLNRWFIRHLTRGPTRWPQPLLARWRDVPDARTDACLAEYLDISLIAQRTAVVGQLIYYPFIVLFVMIVSRIRYFANWDWPLGLLVVFGFNAAGAVFAALTLRRAAERAREDALGRLRRLLFAAVAEGKSSEPLAATARRLVEDIQSVRVGAFGSFAENPVVGALLLPSGATGLVALAQYLPALK